MFVLSLKQPLFTAVRDALSKSQDKLFEAQHPDVTVKEVQIPGNQLTPKLLASGATGNGPDVVLDNVVVEARTCDRDFDWAQVGFDGCDEFVDGRHICDVGFVGDAADVGCHLLGLGLAPEVIDRDVVAARGERVGGGAADAARTSGHQCSARHVSGPRPRPAGPTRR